ncbi:hypothetical protein GLOIN_2v1546369 [Rhizophagus irregularis DAOM 181602=DAOM 197198]|uniref:Uncharacterized protein n=1 Tax=Rhizophagus irregularis (strain DAOM 181602 / DAOM 197198 / MUCL 43194) TaxID=747089 RepID=A0A2P4QIG8_RHIID|nr:hypothetical protein GLOIN_2v1546369 [Rhizophagus irregularis DAOM 181602=DAOM 197198]POG77432.1 hypothetical protein GLOIN_2v1546369 [Rhizophagus irregularis DAOM 181602=DAOM 197198]|eukprot:XP_025184298.1 hypothetical protein GLOIN_2v1546369 [Rhizophagus irregularis DAOM 181602=DAOM 197198]
MKSGYLCIYINNFFYICHFYFSYVMFKCLIKIKLCRSFAKTFLRPRGPGKFY